MTIKEAQEKTDNWIKTYGVRYFNELTNMAILTEEVGELARIISRRYGEQSEKTVSGSGFGSSSSSDSGSDGPDASGSSGQRSGMHAGARQGSCK